MYYYDLTKYCAPIWNIDKFSLTSQLVHIKCSQINTRWRTINMIVHWCMNLCATVNESQLKLSASGYGEGAGKRCIMQSIQLPCFPQKARNRKCVFFFIANLLWPLGDWRGQITNPDTGSNLPLRVHFCPQLLGYTSISCGAKAACDNFRRTLNCSAAITDNIYLFYYISTVAAFILKLSKLSILKDEYVIMTSALRVNLTES